MTRHILVVEDNDLSRELLCDWLESEGYQVTSASALDQAFDAIKKLPPDAVLLDVHRPVVTLAFPSRSISRS